MCRVDVDRCGCLHQGLGHEEEWQRKDTANRHQRAMRWLEAAVQLVEPSSFEEGCKDSSNLQDGLRPTMAVQQIGAKPPLD